MLNDLQLIMPNDVATTLTDQQRAALGAYDRSVSLAAGAGCGKTFVLTERFLSYLDPRVREFQAELQELVAITFTDAAAREMRERIRLRCYRRLQQADDPDEQQAWNRLMRAMDDAKISTIHSFCATLLRTHAAEAAVDPRFEMLDSPAAELLRLQTVDDRLRQLLLEGDERLLQLATRFGLSPLRDNVARLLGENVEPVASRWSETSSEQLVAVWRQYFDQTVVPAATSALLASEPIERLRQICQSAVVSKKSLPGHLQEILGVLADFSGGGDPRALSEQLRSLARVQGVCSKKDWDDPKQYDRFRITCKAVRDLLDKGVWCRPLQEDHLLEAAQTGLDLLQLVADVASRYAQVKQSRNVLEFDDLLFYAHRLLTDPRYPSIRQQLISSTRLLMVDEFQDTDPLQVAIVKAFCGDDWAKQGLFVVGDFKQSIYRFRGAEPRVSSELRATLPEESRLSLTTNFRSQPAILNFVNALFHDAFSEPYEPLRPSRPQATSPNAVEFLWALDDAAPCDDELSRRMGKKQHLRVREARFIARRLAQLLDSGEPLVLQAPGNAEKPPDTRALQLGDIAILLRTLSDVAIYEEALREQGLDYYLAGGHAFYAQQEIYDVLHLLRAIASSIDELSLAGVLRSPIFAFQDETLYWLVQTHGSLNAGLFDHRLPKQLSAQERAKVARAAATIGDLRARKDQLLVAQLLNEAIRRTGYDAMLLCEFLGQRKLANLHKLLEQARSIDRVSPGDLNGFITQLSEFVVRTPKEPLAATQAEGADVIRIMTIHHAKGLEFPLVVVADLGRATRNSKPQPVFDQEIGPLAPAAEKGTFVGWDMRQFVEQQQEEEERKRLLYVACTRAADYLMLSSGVEDLQKPGSDWLKYLGQHFDLQTGRCLTTLPAETAAPQILVTTNEPTAVRRGRGKSRGVDLLKLVDKTRQLAEAGQGRVPDSVQPISVDPQTQKRFSFSRLSGHLIRKPMHVDADLAPDALDSLGLGTLIHVVLERINFSRNNDVPGLCQHLAPQHFEADWQIAAKEASAIVDRFLTSPRAAQISRARHVRREVEFVLAWPGQQRQFQGCFLHGFIDCLYQDAAGGWHILDYKSNQVDSAGVPRVAQQYAMQMFVYSLACQRALGVAPVECTLHFLRPGAEYACAWEDDDRIALTAQLDAAIQSQLEANCEFYK